MQRRCRAEAIVAPHDFDESFRRHDTIEFEQEYRKYRTLFRAHGFNTSGTVADFEPSQHAVTHSPEGSYQRPLPGEVFDGARTDATMAPMSILRYISHPNVDIDPHIPVTEWSLSSRGRHRVQSILEQPWVDSIGHIITSSETKARETADVLAAHLHLAVEERPSSGEIDRSSTGFVPADRHEVLADLFFAEPHTSAHGWERAVDAQRRIVEALSDQLGELDGATADVAIVGHGAVGTLLMCHLDRRAISRLHDQPGQGHYWSYDRSRGRLLHEWRPIDELDEN